MARGTALVVFALLGSAPYQCKSDDPAMARDDTPGEALWYLCGRFAAAHDDKAARETLGYLIDRYPSSRMAKRAKDELGVEHPCAGVAPPSASSSGADGKAPP